MRKKNRKNGDHLERHPQSAQSAARFEASRLHRRLVEWDIRSTTGQLPINRRIMD